MIFIMTAIAKDYGDCTIDKLENWFSTTNAEHGLFYKMMIRASNQLTRKTYEIIQQITNADLSAYGEKIGV